MIENRRLAHAAYSKLVEDLAELQQRIVMRKLVQQEFGEDALPVRDFERTMLSRNDVLSTAVERNRDYDRRDRERAAEMVMQVRAMEEVFERIKSQDDKAFFDAMRERFKDIYGKRDER